MWVTLPSMDAVRAGLQTEVIDDKIYAIGGEDFVDGYALGGIGGNRYGGRLCSVEAYKINSSTTP